MTPRVERSQRIAFLSGSPIRSRERMCDGGEIAENAGTDPGSIRVALQDIHDRAGDFHHHIVPLKAILATYVHAADERAATVDDRRLRVITRQPGVPDGTYTHA